MTDEPAATGLLTIGEAAALLRVSPDTVRRKAERGEVERVPFGGKTLYRLSATDDHIARQQLGVRDGGGSYGGTSNGDTEALLRQMTEALEHEQRMHRETQELAQTLAAQVSTTGLLARQLDQLTRLLSTLLGLEPSLAGAIDLDALRQRLAMPDASITKKSPRSR